MTACEMVEVSDRMRHYARETVFNMTRACLPDVAYHYARAAAHEAHCLLRWVDRAEQTEHDLLTLTVAAAAWRLSYNAESYRGCVKKCNGGHLEN